MAKETVTKAEFDSFIESYPAPLARDYCQIGEPPLLTYNDFSGGKVWPESIVASVIMHSKYDPNKPDVPDEYRVYR